MNDMAKIFWTGRSQAVRLPKQYRFEGTQVKISREGNRIVLEEDMETDHEWVKRHSGAFDEDFCRSVLEDRPGPADMPEGPSFD